LSLQLQQAGCTKKQIALVYATVAAGICRYPK